MTPIDKIIPTAIILILNLVFILVVAILHYKSKNKYKSLPYWLVGNLVTTIGIALALIFSIDKNRVISFVANFLILSGQVMLLSSVINLKNKKLKIYAKTFFIISLILITYSICRNNLELLIGVMALGSVYIYSDIIFNINYNKSKDERAQWLPFTILQSLSLSVYVVIFLYMLLIEKVGLLSLINNNGENFLLKSQLILLTFNSIGVLTIINNVYPKYIDLENKIFREILYYSKYIVIVFEKETGLIKYVNPEFGKKFDYRRTDLIDKKCFCDFFLDSNDYQEVENLIMNNEEIHNRQVKFVTKNKIELIGSISIVPLEHVNESYMLASMGDITHLVNMSDKYQFLASYDELTKLPNRRPFKEKFDMKVYSKEKFALFVLDLDNFKDINDFYGHNTGDEILSKISPKLNKFNLGSDIVSRFGGDEFIFLLNINKDVSNLDDRIKEVLDVFSDKIEINNKLIKVNVSLGVSIYPEDGKSIDQLIETADVALYKAKQKDIDYAVKYKDIKKDDK